MKRGLITLWHTMRRPHHPTVNGDPADSGSMMTRVVNHHQPYQ
ncbi:hypothetical protein ECP03048164_0209 [Escherichia coli P0304816.4]|nr:hypothetical protein ECP03048164_0209 [Escherichia coli P0304816.4]